MSVDQLVEAVKNVRRSDGKLKNAIVTLDSLAPDVKAILGQSPDFELIAENIDDILAVAGSIEDINAAADNIVAIQQSPANAANATASAELAEKWAENPRDVAVEPGKFSAMHWAEVAEEAAGSGIAGVAAFNGRVGAVAPAANDYSAAQVSRGGGSVEDALDALEGDVSAIEALLLSGIDGLLPSNNTGTPNTHVDIGVGKAHVGALAVANPAAVTKRINATWTAGSGNGGLDTGAVAASGTYFLYALRKDADGTFDAVFSTSPTIAGVNTALLAGYTIVKRIGVVLTNASANIYPFFMSPFDEYSFVTPRRDALAVIVGIAPVPITLTVPNGVKTKVKLRTMYLSNSRTSSALFYDPAKGTLVAGGNDSGGNVGAIQVAGELAVGAQDVWTNTSRQIYYVSGAASNVWLWNDGFFFPCGRTS
ncbi:hypothetical protein HF206_07535 [Rhizobium leguminosarum]|uniref:hypothetical protein n=1 Tax=Rhizobium leguminosarum TaxID=384 RepID=UPI001C91934B|nr:hypothetical protein [Rhizobium leguminosarum]MBY2913972.1 hypothetical protein [Rhizobium leguminosarum]